MFCSCGEKIQVLNIANGKVTKTISEVGDMFCGTTLQNCIFFIGCHSVEYYLLKSVFYNLGKR